MNWNFSVSWVSHFWMFLNIQYHLQLFFLCLFFSLFCKTVMAWMLTFTRVMSSKTVPEAWWCDVLCDWISNTTSDKRTSMQGIGISSCCKISFSKVITLSRVTREEMIDSLYERLAQKISYCCKKSGHWLQFSWFCVHLPWCDENTSGDLQTQSYF